MPSMAGGETAGSAGAAGGDKRRKKQATKRMEQLIKIHTETLEQSDACDVDTDITDIPPRRDQHSQQPKLIRNCSNIQLI